MSGLLWMFCMMMARRFICLSESLFGVAGAVAAAAPSSLLAGDILNVSVVKRPSIKVESVFIIALNQDGGFALGGGLKDWVWAGCDRSGLSRATCPFSEYTHLESGILL